MTKKEKLREKFLQNLEAIRYLDLEGILKDIGFEKIPAKGSNTKWKHTKLRNDIIIPVHNHDCKDFYKKQTCKILKDNSLI